jgi:hypothetical protein
VLWAFGKVVNPPDVHLTAGGASPFEAPVLPEVGAEVYSPGLLLRFPAQHVTDIVAFVVGSIIKSVSNRLFTITRIRPNDSISPNSFDKRRVGLRLGGIAFPALVQRYVVIHHLRPKSDTL